ncbi:hypothetical protein GCM10027440_24210 [Nocardiopsis coralliicola]
MQRSTNTDDSAAETVWRRGEPLRLHPHGRGTLAVAGRFAIHRAAVAAPVAALRIGIGNISPISTRMTMLYDVP